MGELNLINHVNMKINAISDVINHLQLEYKWIKSHKDNTSLSLSFKKEMNKFQIEQLDLILFLYDEEKKLFNLKRAHITAAIAHLERRTGMAFINFYSFNPLTSSIIVFNCVLNKLKFVWSFSSFRILTKKERVSAKNSSI
jgi:hypothetical protein